MDQISIDRVGPGQAYLLRDAVDGVFHDPIDQGLVAAYLESPSAMLVVARDEGLLVGQIKTAIHLHPDKPADLYIDELVVARSHQRRGIASRLLREVEKWARERGCADVWLATPTENNAARSLYGRFAESKNCVLYFWDL